MELLDIEVWVMVDEDGDCGVGRDEEEARERYAEDVGGDGPRRLVCVQLQVPRPAAAVVRGSVPLPPESPDVDLTVVQ